MQRIYLDHNATTPLRECAQEKMLQTMQQVWGNPSSTHTSGRQARGVIEEARDQVAELLGVPAREILFTSGGTEADNMALFAMHQMALDKTGRSVGFVSNIEHSAARDSAAEIAKQGEKEIEKDKGIIHWLAPNKQGLLNPQDLRLAEGGSLAGAWASVHWANNETGVVQPIYEFADQAKSLGMLFHSDAVQALGRVDIDMKKFAGDLLSISAHKIGGPKGVGALWVKDAEAIPSLFFGGAQEREVRPGTENLYGIAGFGAAARETLQNQMQERAASQALRDEFEARLKTELGDEILIHGEGLTRLPNTSSVLFKKKTADLMLMALDIRGFDLSAGSACSSGSVRFSPVIKAMGFSENEAASTLRISFGRGNKKEDLDLIIKALVDVVRI